MKWRDLSVLLTGWKVQGFLRDYAALLGPVTKAAVRRELDTAVATLGACNATQKAQRTTGKSLTIVKNQRRQDLLTDHLAPLVPIARRRTKENATLTPDIQGMRMPKRRMPDNILATEARTMAEAASLYRDVYLKQQLPEDFEAQAKRAAYALQHALDARNASMLAHAAATKEGRHQASLVRSFIKVLHTLVVKRLNYMKRPELIEVWNDAKRYPKKPGPKRARNPK